MRAKSGGRIILVIVVVIALTAYSSMVGLANPSGQASVAIAMAQAFNNLVLTAAAIFFAFSFADARYWPTIGEAALASFFGWWGIVAVFGMVVDWTGQYTSNSLLTLLSLILWFIASGLSVLCLVRILYIGNPQRLNEYLGRSLARLLKKGDAARFLRATREATTIGADLMIRDLTDQLEMALKSFPPSRAGVRTAAEFVSETTWECFGDSITGLTAARAMRNILDPGVLIPVDGQTRYWKSGKEDYIEVVGETFELIVPLISRFISQAKYFSEQGEKRSYESIITAGEHLLGEYATVFDPEPQVQNTSLARQKLALSNSQVLSIYRAFSIRPCISTPRTTYSVYQLLTGTRFPGDYWKSDPIVRQLIDETYDTAPHLESEISGIYSDSLLSWTLAPLADHLGTSEEIDGKELIAASAWLKIILSIGSIDDSESALRIWREVVFHHESARLGNTVSGSSVHEIAVGAAVLSILRLRPWLDSSQFDETRKFYNALSLPMRKRVNQLLLRIIGVSVDSVRPRILSELRGLVLDV